MKKTIAILLISLFIAGCGGDDNNINLSLVDNSTLADGKNEWGYYGTDVLFGEYPITQSWTAIDETDNTKTSFEFFSDGEFVFDDYYVGSYGVSLDGRKIKSNILNDISITGVKEDYYGVYNNGILQYTLDCYDIIVGGHPLVMCPASI